MGGKPQSQTISHQLFSLSVHFLAAPGDESQPTRRASNPLEKISNFSEPNLPIIYPFWRTMKVGDF
jgi:hypothetical protein